MSGVSVLGDMVFVSYLRSLLDKGMAMYEAIEQTAQCEFEVALLTVPSLRDSAWAHEPPPEMAEEGATEDELVYFLQPGPGCSPHRTTLRTVSAGRESTASPLR